MNTLTFFPGDKDIALVIKDSMVLPGNKGKMGAEYFSPIGAQLGETIASRCMAIGCYQPAKGKVKAKDKKAFGAELLEYFDTKGIDTILVADGDYFEYFTGHKGIEKACGKRFTCQHEGFEHLTFLPLLNWVALAMTPQKREIQGKAIKAAASHLSGNFQEEQVFEFAEDAYTSYKTPTEVAEGLTSLLNEPLLACDIEATGLRVGKTEILTIAFSKDEKSAKTFAIHPMYGYDNKSVLKKFFEDYEGTMIYHNGSYDVKHICYDLFMKDFDDHEGMHAGLDILCPFEDTRLIAYLAKNSTERPGLGLKELSYEYLGDYAEDVKDATLVPVDDLLLYNGKDTCGTFYVYNKFLPKMQEDEQESVYNMIFKPSLRPLLEMMITGMPLDLDAVADAKAQMLEIKEDADTELSCNEYVVEATTELRRLAAKKYNDSHKTIQKTPSDFSDLTFNPGSTLQLRILLFDVMGLTPIEFTKNKAPSTNRASIQEWYNEEEHEGRKACLKALINVSQVGIILSTFIGAFEDLNIEVKDGNVLHGDFVLGGTTSGRLSSKQP